MVRQLPLLLNQVNLARSTSPFSIGMVGVQRATLLRYCDLIALI